MLLHKPPAFSKPYVELTPKNPKVFYVLLIKFINFYEIY